LKWQPRPNGQSSGCELNAAETTLSRRHRLA
jgi:hypothetical protein